MSETGCVMALTGVSGILWNDLLNPHTSLAEQGARVGKPYGTDCPASSFARMCHSAYIFLFRTLFEATLNVSWLSK